MDKYQLHLERVAENERAMIRALRVLGKMSLARAHRLHRYLAATPDSVIAAGIDRAVAEHVLRELREAGATARLEPSAVPTPLVLEPKAHVIYEWSAVRTLRKRTAR